MSEKKLPRVTPEEVGVESAAIGKMLDGFKEKGVGVHGLMLMRHNKVFAEGWYAPYRPDLTHMLFSLSKSFTSTAIGFAVQEGLLTVEDRVVDFFPEKLPFRPCENMEKMRVKHLLTMNTGHSVEPENMLGEPDKDWVKIFLESYVDHEPGTLFCYNTCGTYMLSAILTKITGLTVDEYLKPRLFEPLGIEGWRFEKCPSGNATGGYGLNVHLEDIAKFGLFYLNRGMWEGKQLLNPEWIDAATSKQTDSVGEVPDWVQGYGYQFWRCQPEGSYRGDGAFGQYCIVLPKQDMVIAMNEGTGWLQDPLDVLWETLLPALHDEPLPENAEKNAEIQARLAKLTLPPAEGEKASPDAAKYSGMTYTLSPNPIGLSSVRFDLDGGNPTFTMTLRDMPPFAVNIGQRSCTLPLGFGEFKEGKGCFAADECGSFTFFYEQCAASMAWRGTDTLVMRLAWNTTPFVDDVTVSFDEQGIVVDWSRNYTMAPVKSIRIFGRRDAV